MTDTETMPAELSGDDVKAIERLTECHARLKSELSRVIVGQVAVVGAAGIRVERPHAAYQRSHLRNRQRQEVRFVDHHIRRRTISAFAEVVAECVSFRPEYIERLDIGLILRRVRAARYERNLHVVPAVLRSLLDGCRPT